MIDWLHFAEKGIWLGFAAVGFAILFNVPVRTLWIIFIVGALGGLTKAFIMSFDHSVIMASFAGATAVGVLSVFASHSKHSPALVFAIPSVIPMVPGVFSYKTMLGLIRLAGNTTTDDFSTIINETVNNGLKALFILLTLAIGVALPLLITRKESTKDLLFVKKEET
ncbi:uncharacterized membrane protein YjjB (DUF3815 family) [Breznakibacter xylanolyticus]|uniref:Uncharacterized membrane protein YjjB (DUF3815 family) n=1 Tax=Breznakibacter xylanolyticus TaxID=990 RepID=A0A2W7QBS2_9BACT|nr:threonine/serine exporter family protein [Breznakibacter xylanolyticus]MBN2743364.1 threonine/serine exporter family protein [Marinilabiliaceae bacterium]PZX19209.1 uncharacterized membrane protein YjjB (DUF3815 family) [Breznakibacter xylanolyticus]